jgi:hypothetical protein
MKKTVLIPIISIIFFVVSCSITSKILPSGSCTDDLDIAAITFENQKHRVSSLTSLISNTGLLNAADKSLSDNLSTVAGWVSGLPRLDKVHKEATRYIVSSNDNFLKAVGEKETLDKIEKEIADLGKTASEDEKQAKYLQILNDPKLQEKMGEASKKTEKISTDKKEFLDKAYIHMTYGIIFDATTVGISSMVVTEGKSQIDGIKNSIKEPLEAARKTTCVQKSVGRAVDISSSAKDQVSPSITIFNAIVKLYSSSGYKLPAVATADGKPVTSDLP